jgi:hypothetical protein
MDLLNRSSTYIWRDGCTREDLVSRILRCQIDLLDVSDQLVTLTTTVPPTDVRIVTITEHGLLRTMPESRSLSRWDDGFIDLQPDGNSFDMMAGLIKVKNSW